MSNHIGKVAVVIGAGVGGLTAARALSNHYEQVIVIESDEKPSSVAPRPGAPQGKHLHALLAGGLNALKALFPGFDQDLIGAGAVSIGMTQDFQLYRPGYHPFPQRDLGLTVYSISRPLIEFLIRKRVEEFPNIEFRQSCRALQFTMDPRAQRIKSVTCQTPDQGIKDISLDCSVDATGHGVLTLNLLASLKRPQPEEIAVEVDIGYATTAFDIPDDAPTGWKALVVHPHPGENRRSAFLFPIEGNQWMAVLSGRHDEKPSADVSEFFAHLQSLPTPALYNALRSARRCSEISRYVLKASRWRRFDRNYALPDNLIPFADTICRFNPVYGQGMSVAAQQASVLQSVLSAANSADAADQLGREFVLRAQSTIEAPWATAVLPDFADERTSGERPPELNNALKFSAALFKKASEDPAVHRTMLEVQHLLKPRSALRELQIEC